MRTGFIGVGLMGHGMAKCLIEKGHALTVMGHRNRSPVDDLVKRGATEAKRAAEVAKNSDIVFLCVTGSTQVEALVRGPDGIAVACLTVIPTYLIYHVVTPVPLALAIKQIVFDTIRVVLMGIVLAWINR